MDACFDCFAPTVGTYILPSSLLKQDGRLYACASFDVPESLGFGNVFTEPLRAIIERANNSEYLRTIANGGGLKGLHGKVSAEFTQNTTCGGFCDSCGLLSDRWRTERGLLPVVPLPIIPTQDLLRRLPGAG
ncbi:SPASM domain-containing protein [Kitasatospora sp. NPDC001159]